MRVRVNNSIADRYNFFMHITAVVVRFPLIICKVVAGNHALAAVYLVLKRPSVAACEVLVNVVKNICFVLLVYAVGDIFYRRVGIKKASYDRVNCAVYHRHKSFNSAWVVFLYANIAVKFPVILPCLVVVLLSISPGVVKLLQKLS